jgi:hypothetical protein
MVKDTSRREGGFRMVKTINNLRIKFEQWLTTLECRLYGHTDVKVIEVYKRTQIVRVALGNSTLKKLCSKSPFLEVTIDGKLKCTHCGCVFIGRIKCIDKGAIIP